MAKIMLIPKLCYLVVILMLLVALLLNFNKKHYLFIVMKKRITKHILFWFFYLSFEVYTQFEWVLGQYQYLTPYQVFYIVFSAETILVLLIKIPIVYIVFVLITRYNTNRYPDQPVAKLAEGRLRALQLK